MAEITNFLEDRAGIIAIKIAIAEANDRERRLKRKLMLIGADKEPEILKGKLHT